MPDERGTWSSRLGFVLSAAGSAIGLGNIWAFPTRVGQGGGAAFVVLYLGCVFLICLPILIAEVAMGRRSQKNPVGAFQFIKPGSPWWLVGGLGVLAGVAILSFYSVVAGWTVAYIWFTGTGAVGSNADAARAFFADFTANGPLNLFLTFLILAATAASILGGVRSGIERVNKILMPFLFALLIVLAVRAITLPGAAAGIAYYLKPIPGKLLSVQVLSSALGQAFFSLSLGIGTMLTYGSYMSKKDGIGAAAVWVVVLDTSVALLAGFLVFPAGFSIEGFDPSASGPGLIFAVLPRLFAALPGGNLFGAAFFILLVLAAITSTISLLEVPVSYLIDERHWSRTRAVVITSAVSFVLALPSVLSNGAVAFLSNLPGIGMDFLSLMVRVWNDFSLPIGGFFIAIFVGHIWKVDHALIELREHNAWFPAPKLWGVLIRFACPAAIAFIIVVTLLS